jgi:amino acid adenylation domain-containing protein/non-ribosomal peptide synthase protein (TIGR01720 family)
MIIKKFQEQAAAAPDHIAIKTSSRTISYRELNAYGNQLANAIMTNDGEGSRDNRRVSLLLSHGAEMIIAVIGVLKAGKTYIPLDSTYPEKRLSYMLEDSNSYLVLTDTANIKLVRRLIEQGKNKVGILNIDSLDMKPDAAVDIKRPVKEDEKRLAYILYTSGSTGFPKGVMQTHGNVLYYIHHWIQRFSIGPSDRMTFITSFSHDQSIQDIFASLLSGACLFPYDIRSISNVYELYSCLMGEKITIWHSVPSVFRFFANSLTVKDHFYDMRWLLLGGEAMREYDLDLYKAHFPKARLVNIYGQTESSFTSGCIISPQNTFDDVSLGDPLPGTQILLVDEEGGIVDKMGIGEVVVASDFLAPGYWNDKEKTGEVFEYDDELGRFYWTGDLGRLTAEGKIKMIGRKDLQVKIRGFRVETGEIETRLLQYPGVKEAAIVSKEDENGDNYLCAFFVSRESIPPSRFREYLGQEIPEYMIPRYFISLEQMPVTPSGKIDRKRLPEPDEDIIARAEYEPPTNDLERKMVGIWQEVLGIEKIGIHDNFIELGGHSLLVIAIISGIHQALGVELQLRDVFDHPTVKELSELIIEMTKSQPSLTEEEKKVKYQPRTMDLENLYEPFPLTHIQEAYLLGRGDHFEIGGVSTHIYLEMSTRFDLRRFNNSLNKVIARHPVLRTIVTEDGQQKILKEVPRYEIIMTDLSHLDAKEQKKKILQERQRMAYSVLNLYQWPLFELKAMKLSSTDLYLFIGFDMIVSDAHSVQMIFEDLDKFYLEPGFEPAPLEFTFRDYVLALQELRESDVYTADRDYWLNKLADFPLAPRLPMVCKPSEVEIPTFRNFNKYFLKEELDHLQHIAKKNKITISILFCTAFAQVLSYWSNQRRFTLNLPLFNRYPFHKDVFQIVGNFTAVLLLEVDWDENLSFLEMAARLQEVLMENMEHRHYDGIEFMRDIRRYNQLSSQAVMPVVFNSQVTEESKSELNFQSIEEKAEIKAGAAQTSQVFIELHVGVGGDGIIISWDYVEELFDPLVIKTMYQQFMEILNALTRGETGYPLLPPQKHRELWENYNKTPGDFPRAALHQLFTQQVQRTPHHIALEFADNVMPYCELDEKSNQVAAYLREQGVKPNTLVGVLTSRSFETIINVMGVLKSGGAYVPIDPEYPGERRDYIYKDAGCRLLLEPDIYVKENLARYPADPVANVNILQDLAYVIYTSGSTGRPKGVVITHQEAANTIIDINQKYQVNETDRILGISSMCFDLSVYDVFGALSTGARLVLIPTQKDIDVLFEALDTKKITFWNSVPAILDMVVKSLEEDYLNPYLKRALLSGDWIPLTLPAATRKHFPNCEAISLGGATEGSIWSIYYPIKETRKEWKSIPYGYPLANQAFYVLNGQLQLCPVGVPGDLYIGGVGVAEGYINDVEKTSNAYYYHHDFGRIYRTGDQGVFHNEGYIEFLGRKDHQVKIRGYRVELGEIESCLLEHELVKSAIVLERINHVSPGARYLCAYIVLNGTGDNKDDQVPESALNDLKGFLSQKLPNYMVPSFFIPLPEFPLTANGKIDHKRLPDPEASNLDTPSQYISPRNPIEEKQAEIWSTILNRHQISINDNFFMIGGDSIKAIQVATRLKRDGYKVELRNFFRFPTIAELTPYIKRLSSPADQSLVTGTIPLTPIQEYFFEKVKRDPHHFNQALMLFTPQRFETEILQVAFQKLQEHHDALRITIREEKAETVQTINGPDHPLSLEVYDYRQLPGARSEAIKKLETKANEIQASIDLPKGPLMKLGLFHLDNGDYLLVVIHHLVIDGVSWRILLEDFEIAYRLAQEGKEIQLALKTTSFKEWAQQLYRYANSKEFLKERTHWEELQQTAVSPLPKKQGTQKQKSLLKDSRGQSFELSLQDTEKLLNQVNRAYNTEINDILLVGLSLALHRWAGMENALVALEGHGREEIIEGIDITRTIGWFTSFYPVILDMKNAADISQMIKTNKDMLRRIPNKGIGYGILKYLTAPENKPGLTLEEKPEIVFNYLGQVDDTLNSNLYQLADLSPGHSFSPNSDWVYSLDISGIISQGKLRITVTYNSRHHTVKRISDFSAQYKRSLVEVIHHCAARQDTETTLSDYASSDFSQEEVEQIFDVLEGTFE